MSSPGVGGSLSAASDVYFNNPTQNETLKYNDTLNMWTNDTPPAGATGPTGPASTVPGPTGPSGATGPAGTTTWAGITDKPPQVQYAYYTTSWPARPVADTVIWVVGNETTPPSVPEVGKDIWIRDSDVV